MNVYQYIANSNPSFAKKLLYSYGYSFNDVRTNNDLGVCLQQLISYEGEPALRDMMNGHPDKDVILEIFSLTPKENFSAADGMRDSGKPCAGCRGNCRHTDNYSNFDGGGQQSYQGEKSAFSLTSVSIIAASLLLAVAIISKPS